MSDSILENVKKVPREFSHNLQHHLWDRESGYNRHSRANAPVRHGSSELQMYKCFTPNLTIHDVMTPPGYMRKFTPNGQLLISFALNQRSLCVYKFKGVNSASHLLEGITSEFIAASEITGDCENAYQIFYCLFELKWCIRLANMAPPCLLNREFSIFLGDGRYVLVAATMPYNGTNIAAPVYSLFLYSDINDDCKFLGYVFYLIDLEKGIVSDILVYKCDWFLLRHNHGVSAYGHKIAFLSKFRQNIDLFELVDGRMKLLTSIGDFKNDNERLAYQQIPESRTFPSCLNKLPLSYLKQRILTCLFHDIMSMESGFSRNQRLLSFYRDFPIYEKMVMVKMQFIDEDHFLIRYEEGDTDGDSPDFKLYVFYRIPEGLVLGVYPMESVELLQLLTNYCDNIRNVRSLQTQRPATSPSNNVQYRATFQNYTNNVPGGVYSAARRYNKMLPISTQSFTTTPYMDYSLFHYDENLISALERPKICTFEPIPFSDPNTSITMFRLFLEPPYEQQTETLSSMCDRVDRGLVAFIFHPHEPLIISVQKRLSHYVVNFHLYNPNTIVEQEK